MSVEQPAKKKKNLPEKMVTISYTEEETINPLLCEINRKIIKINQKIVKKGARYHHCIDGKVPKKAIETIPSYQAQVYRERYKC